MQVFLLIAVFLVLLIALPMYLNKRAVIKVVKIFRSQGVTDAESAKSLEELRLTPPTLRERMLRFRDYKPAALKGLVQVGVVLMTEDGRYYLSEEKLKGTKLANIS